MKRREKKAKISNYSLTVMFYLLAIIAFACYAVFAKLGVGSGYFIFLGIVSLLAAVFWTVVSRTIHMKYVEMYQAVSQIEENHEKIKAKLEKNGFASDEHFSAFGYKYFELRDDFNVPDNYHIEFDIKAKKIVVYSLIPFSFREYNVDDLKSCSTRCDYQYQALGKKYFLLTLVIAFADGYNLELSVCDNKPFAEYSDEETKYRYQAEMAKRKIKEIMESGNEYQREQGI